MQAEAIGEAAMRPGMRLMPAKNGVKQAGAVVFRARHLLVLERMQCIDGLRGQLAVMIHGFRGPVRLYLPLAALPGLACDSAGSNEGAGGSASP